MKITDRDHARNWAHNLQNLHHPFVLVDEDGNIHCLQSAKDMATVATEKEADQKGYHIVKGKLPADFVSTINHEKPIEDAK